MLSFFYPLFGLFTYVHYTTYHSISFCSIYPCVSLLFWEFLEFLGPYISNSVSLANRAVLKTSRELNSFLWKIMPGWMKGTFKVLLFSDSPTLGKLLIPLEPLFSVYKRGNNIYFRWLLWKLYYTVYMKSLSLLSSS